MLDGLYKRKRLLAVQNILLSSLKTSRWRPRFHRMKMKEDGLTEWNFDEPFIFLHPFILCGTIKGLHNNNIILHLLMSLQVTYKIIHFLFFFSLNIFFYQLAPSGPQDLANWRKCWKKESDSLSSDGPEGRSLSSFPFVHTFFYICGTLSAHEEYLMVTEKVTTWRMPDRQPCRIHCWADGSCGHFLLTLATAPTAQA